MKTNSLSRLALLLLPFALVLAVVVLSMNDHASRAKTMVVVDTSAKGPQIKFEEEVYDFKEIEQNTIVEHTFVIQNVGKDTLTIVSTRPSCGCTAAVMDNSNIAPGGTAHLKVTFDANHKAEGFIAKTITVSSNSVDQADKVIRIQGKIVASKTAHKTSMMHIDGVFEGDCARCHVDKGRGELGARLFDADCGICHGLKADGKPGPAVGSDEMMRHTPKEWKQIISNGLPNSNMPAFHSKNKGPLGDEEIASVVEYLSAVKKELSRSKTMHNVGVKQ